VSSSRDVVTLDCRPESSQQDAIEIGDEGVKTGGRTAYVRYKDRTEKSTISKLRSLIVMTRMMTLIDIEKKTRMSERNAIRIVRGESSKKGIS
jgi:hypothetical protein